MAARLVPEWFPVDESRLWADRLVARRIRADRRCVWRVTGSHGEHERIAGGDCYATKNAPGCCIDCCYPLVRWRTNWQCRVDLGGWSIRACDHCAGWCVAGQEVDAGAIQTDAGIVSEFDSRESG